MARGSSKLSKKQRFLLEHPKCCFCGGNVAATTIDHIPPKSCFPRGYHPDGFEFPACANCNGGSKALDQVFAFYAKIANFDIASMTWRDRDDILKLRSGMMNNTPAAMIDDKYSRAVFHTGVIYTPAPIAMEFPVPLDAEHAMRVSAMKIAHAIHYKEVNAIIGNQQLLAVEVFQPQYANFQEGFDALINVLPGFVAGARSNIRNYGRRFDYRYGVIESKLFTFLAWFHAGLAIKGIILCPGVMPSEFEDPLRSQPWRCGGDVFNAQLWKQ